MAAIHSALNLVGAFRRSYLALNVLYYGLVAAAIYEAPVAIVVILWLR